MTPDCLGCGGGVRQASRAVQVCFGLVLVALALIAVATAQEPVVKLSGTVSTIEGEAVAGAMVALLTSEGAIPETAALREVRTVLAPDSRFEWLAVPPGAYRVVVASADAFKDWPSEPSVQRLAALAFPLTLNAGQGPVRVVFAMGVGPAPAFELSLVNVSVQSTMVVGGPGGPPPGAPPRPGASTSLPIPRAMTGPSTIAGVITDVDGRPLSGVQVQAGRRRSPTAPRSSAFLPIGLPATTDATGAYRMEGLQPGAYVIGALAWKFDIDGFLSASVRTVPAETDASGQRMGPLTTYFPGVGSTRSARLVTIDIGETEGIDFAVLRGPVSTVTVRLGEPDRRGPGLALAYMLPASVPEQFGQRNGVRAVPDATGAYTFADVQHGEYVLTHFSFSGWTRESVTVQPSEPLSIAFVLKPYLTVSGRVDLRPTRVSGGPDVLTTLAVSVTSSPLTSGSPIQRAPVSADGTFLIPRVPGGPSVLTLARGDVAWLPLSGVMNGQDSLDLAVDIQDDVTDATLVVTDRATTVQGTVIGMSRGRVAVFSSDDRHWVPGGSRRVRVATIVPGGAFSVSGLPPGTYHAAAFLQDARIVNSALEQARARTAPFELAIGEQKEITVR